MKLAWDKGYRSHEHFAQGMESLDTGKEFLLTKYNFRPHHERAGLYLNESSTGVVAISARPKDFSVVLFDGNEAFVPNPDVLDYRIIAHFIKTANVARLVLADGRPIDDGLYSALLSCYVDGRDVATR